MLAMIMTWLGGKLAGPIAVACALLLAAALLWQTARIDGLPLIGGGFKSQVAGLQQQVAARDLAQARAQAAALQARSQLADAQDAIARAASTGDQAIQNQIQTVIREVLPMSMPRMMLPVLCLGALCGCSTPPPAAPMLVTLPPVSPPASLMTPPRTLSCLRLRPCSPAISAPPARMPGN